MSGERGFVLPAVMFALAIMALIAVIAYRTADDERRATKGLKDSGTVLYAAEAGLRQTMGSWDTTATNLLNPGDSLHLNWQQLPTKASYQTTIHRVDGGGLQVYAVVVEARGAGPNPGLSSVVAMVTGVPVFKWGLYSNGNITMGGGASTDGFNSALGPYGVTMDSGGSVATNGSVLMSGANTIVKGDASAQGSVSGGTVTGATNNNTPPFPLQPILSCPAGGYTPISTSPGINYTAGSLQVNAGKTLTLTAPPGTYYFHDLILNGNSTLVTNGNITIIVDGTLNLSGGTVINMSGVASNLNFSACGPTTSPWVVAGGAGAYFTLYAPNHDVSLAGQGDVYGAMVVGSFTASGGGKLHYDEALLNQPSNRRAIMPGSWAQRPGT